MYNYELRGCNKRPFCEDPPDGPPCDCKNSDYPGIPRVASNDLLTVLKKQPYLERWVCVTMRIQHATRIVSKNLKAACSVCPS
jgi:hypothetical protein